MPTTCRIDRLFCTQGVTEVAEVTVDSYCFLSREKKKNKNKKKDREKNNRNQPSPPSPLAKRNDEFVDDSDEKRRPLGALLIRTAFVRKGFCSPK